jgi:hypothetical protein
MNPNNNNLYVILKMLDMDFELVEFVKQGEEAGKFIIISL